MKSRKQDCIIRTPKPMLFCPLYTISVSLKHISGGGNTCTNPKSMKLLSPSSWNPTWNAIVEVDFPDEDWYCGQLGDDTLMFFGKLPAMGGVYRIASSAYKKPAGMSTAGKAQVINGELKNDVVHDCKYNLSFIYIHVDASKFYSYSRWEYICFREKNMFISASIDWVIQVGVLIMS